MKALAAGLVACGLVALASGQGEVQPEVLEQIQTQVQANQYQMAMALAHGVADDPERFALEADILFQARSYRAALGRAQEAEAGGIHTPLLLARGIGSALWLGEGEVALAFWPAFDQAISALPADAREAWVKYASNLRPQVDDLVVRERAVVSHVARARCVSLGLLSAAVLGLTWLLKIPRRSRPALAS